MKMKVKYSVVLVLALAFYPCFALGNNFYQVDEYALLFFGETFTKRNMPNPEPTPKAKTLSRCISRLDVELRNTLNLLLTNHLFQVLSRHYPEPDFSQRDFAVTVGDFELLGFKEETEKQAWLTKIKNVFFGSQVIHVPYESLVVFLINNPKIHWNEKHDSATCHSTIESIGVKLDLKTPSNRVIQIQDAFHPHKSYRELSGLTEFRQSS